MYITHQNVTHFEISAHFRFSLALFVCFPVWSINSNSSHDRWLARSIDIILKVHFLGMTEVLFKLCQWFPKIFQICKQTDARWSSTEHWTNDTYVGRQVMATDDHLTLAFTDKINNTFVAIVKIFYILYLRFVVQLFKVCKTFWNCIFIMLPVSVKKNISCTLHGPSWKKQQIPSLLWLF